MGWRLLTLILVMLCAQARSATLLFVANGDSPEHREFLARQRQWQAGADLLALDTVEAQGTRLMGLVVWLKSAPSPRKSLPARVAAQTLMRARSPTLADLCQQVDVVVAVAGDAARAAEQNCSIPLLMVLVPDAQLQPLLERTRGPARTAIYPTADPVANLRLIRELLPKATTVGVLVSPQRAELPSLRAEAHRLQFKLEEITATNDEEAVRALRNRVSALDAVLLLPDLQLINAWSLKPILLMTIRQMVPTFGGPTADYVRAGVLAAAVPDLDRLPAQIVAVARRLASGVVPAPVYPEATRVVVNPTVAGVLSVVIPPTWNAHAE